MASLYTYIVVCVEVIGVIFYMFGAKFFQRGLASGIVDSLYYLIVIIGCCAFNVFAIRTYEKRERAGFLAELNSRNELQCWKDLLNDLPEPVILSQAGVLTFCNNATQQFFINDNEIQLSDTQIMERLEKVKPKEGDRPSLAELIREYSPVQPHENVTRYFKYNHNGKEHKLEVKGVEINHNNGGTIVEHIIHDITAVEDLEHEKAEKHCLQVLVATASHDIRTPINAIQGAIDTLYLSTFDKASQTQVKMIQTAVKKLLLYIRGLSYLELVETKLLQVDKTVFDARRAVEDLIDSYDFTLQNKQVQIEIECPSDFPFIVSDKEKYETILYHLLENATKNTFEGHIDITLSYSNEDRQLVTQVKDTGVGIKPEDIRYLFKLFARPRPATPLNPKGIGLGLYLAKALAIELGGDITLTSTPGVGTIVTFTIKQQGEMMEITEPMTETDAMMENMNEKREYRPVPSMSTFLGSMGGSSGGATAAEDEKRSSSPSATDRDLLASHRVVNVTPATPKRMFSVGECDCNPVLIVDDEQMNVMVLTNYLIPLRLSADTAPNGEKAIEMILHRRESCRRCKGYRLILMDINMPVMDGIEATGKIRDLMKESRIPEAPIVAVTAAAHLESKSVVAAYQKVGFTKIRTFLGRCYQ